MAATNPTELLMLLPHSFRRSLALLLPIFALESGVVRATQAGAEPPLPDATYQVTFDATWSDSTHPKAFPNGAHFSSLIGAVHRDGVSFWKKGKKASKGVEKVAELGSTSLFAQEIQAAIEDDEASMIIQGGGVSSPGSTATTLTATDAHPRVTLITMVAPSPDWFVGVNGLELRDESGWIDELEVPLYAWDAGTDHGKSYKSGNDNATPKKKVKRLKKGPLKKTFKIPMGSFRFVKIK